METIRIKWTGLRPLVMHSARMIDPDNPHVRRKNELQRQLKKMKKDDDVGREKIRRQIERCEWEGSMYWSQEAGLYVPGPNIAACIVAGARKGRSGKQAEQALIPPADAVIVTTRKTKDIEAMYSDPAFSLRWAVRIPPKTGSRVMSVRPVVPTGWTITFELEFEETILPRADLIEANQTAGGLFGLGDWRPTFGRFLAEVL